ncbi:hypothetical protein LCGC14_1567970 [marine sediment metagenome]|uniref:Uncharacterized protein n=1 Tax=marine sediment metagenome TaxID=412755 RepID=A0A0F9IKH2_9ZZZZ
MAKRNVTSFRQVLNIPFKEVDAGRRSIPYLRRTEQQNIRDTELKGAKVGMIQAAPVAFGSSGSVAANAHALINLTLTHNGGNAIVAWPQVNIYVDNDNDIDSLWFKGDDVGFSAEALLSMGWVQLINTSVSGLRTNQAQMQGIFINRDSSAHTYHVHVRWLYMLIK